MSEYTLHLGDCLEVMATMPDNSVDAVITDPPYGTTACKWDSVIPLDPMWAALKRVIKPKGAIVLFAAQPFTSALVMSNVEWFKYQWVWEKTRPFGFLHAKNKPMTLHEDITIFGDGIVAHSGASERMTYNPQMAGGQAYKKKSYVKTGYRSAHNYARPSFNDYTTVNDGERYPTTVLHFDNDNHDAMHPTQKPVDLLRYLVRTYTNAGETVLDFTMGSGTTGVACMMEERRFIGIELERQYFDIAERRISEATYQRPLFSMAAD